MTLRSVVLLFVCAPWVWCQSPPPASVEYTNQVERYLDQLIAKSPVVHEKAWNRDFTSIDHYRVSVAPNRRRLVEMIGGFQCYSRTSLEPRVERIAERPAYRVERVRIHALPELDASGILLVPTGVQLPRPAVIVQHGLGGSPEGIAGLIDEDDSYHKIGARLAEQGFVVWANRMTQGVETKSRLDRKAKMIGQRLQALEQWMLMRVVDYLQTRPEVRADRIAIYGKSWGGRTALYAGAIDERIAAVVANGHFNQTVPKMVTRSPHYGTYLDSKEDYAFFMDLANQFSDSDVASLICPRPLYIEQGSRDRVVYVPMAQEEFQIVKSYYHRLGVEERAAMEVFDGEHEIRGRGSIAFLKKWLLP